MVIALVLVMGLMAVLAVMDLCGQGYRARHESCHGDGHRRRCPAL
ncbi:MAG: hypothetical protein ACKOEN_02690 [Betaproteobacteria bacterium]